MKNFEIAKILYHIALYLEIEGEQFKPRAYEKAARSIEALTEDVSEIYKRGGIRALMEIPGVGESIATKIEEMILTGKLKYYEQLKEKIPVDIENLSAIEGIGPKTIKTLYQKLKIKTVEDLEKAAKERRIRKLKGFGEKSEEDILRAIEFFKRSKGRFILGYVLPLLRDIEERLRKLPEVKKVNIAGSTRRMKETIGDADFLVVSDKPEKVMDFFVHMPEVSHVYGKGSTKTMVKLKNGLDADVRVIPEKSYGAALQYFTGSKDHNITLRRIAIEKSWKLSEYGVFDKNGKYLFGKTEEEVYEGLGLKWIPPELRENTGEIEAAMKNKLPKLIDYNSLKGDLQIQTKWTDGTNSIKEMAEEAKKLGLEYIAITDHTKSLAFTGGLDEKKLLEQKKEIEKVNKELEGIIILSGAEVNILKDGKLDISDKILSQLDVVGASVHSHFNLSKTEQTNRIIKAMENENVDILFHPTGRQLQVREPYEVDIEKIIQVAKDTGTVLEINAFPDRLDLKDEHIKKAVEIGAKLIINSDSHNKHQIHYLEFGIAQARRGWAEAKDIVNTRKLNEFLKMLKH
ncbi:MAG: DNA polymerase/3'-5' exonuclease PolX [Candidatus Aenigmatarchaeota archaeon]|nr:DNA polymerase/3'-5' exonuclease PolX [Candidatus Aenigmarchaeota archaeon]